MSARSYFVVLLWLLIASSCTDTVTQTTEKVMTASPNPGMVHTVFFWLKEDVTPAQAAEFQQALRQLEKAPSVRRMLVGPAASTPLRDVTRNDFDYSLILWFDDVAGHDAYQVHPVHTDFATTWGPIFAKVLVYDSAIE